MDSSGYRSDGVGLAVAIVNAVYGADSDADDGELLEQSLHEYGVMNRTLSAREKAGLRGWAGHLHNVFAADSASEAAHLLNQLLDVVVTHPYLTDHGGSPGRLPRRRLRVRVRRRLPQRAAPVLLGELREPHQRRRLPGPGQEHRHHRLPHQLTRTSTR